MVGGAQYEPLHAEIEEWEELTGERHACQRSLDRAHVFDAATDRSVRIG
ncbi:MAG: hypothetical protein OXF88_13685 [Rhodobacteraceae bacterium]|nr:hypothetical protein [Paracoccaceae bacterium]